ncbi:HlyD family secretion protein [Novosphingobium taihuense]|uniref:Membrane fusion protein (Multidrug efflux system) n=1 Tax=Novosphingobium taihuense TaxID=260085 RepID=A0A7W7ACF3_9SPHN|nr:HlyD family secretion protein [Novosphingobium taihuense]MBB4613602.1 membrane fusion protein (multidrug efflux system) [Novosphingobium taihuense]TWH81155.1 membrane fusion protein (multidrug efflux system) [Novosphingobium taihuense]
MAATTESTPAPTTDATDGRRRTIGRIAVGALAAGALYGAWALYDYETVGRYMQDTEDAYVKADGVTISSKLGGYVRRVSVTDNQAVEQGTLLVQIDPTDYDTRLAQSNAQVDVARATEAAALAAIQEAQSATGQARAALQASQRELAYLNGEVARMRPLVASGAEPRQAFDQLVANRDKAMSDVSAKQAALAAANDRIASARAQAGQSTAQIKAAQAQREAASTDLATTRIIAPIGGKVGNSTVRLGQFVQPGQRLMTIVPTQAIYVEANFKETQIGLMRPGQPVTVHVDALPDVEFHGTVESITPGTGANFSLIPPQNATGNFTKIVQRVPVRIRINAGPESRKVLVPGLSLSVEVDTRSAKSAIDAIRDEQERAQAK